METEESRELTVVTERSISDVVRQVDKIQELITSVMKDGEHYGTIPGCGKKKNLLKPGAEKLAATFQLTPEYTIIMRELAGNHRDYQITCTLRCKSTGIFLGQGVGCCSTMETKYRFRSENTGKPVPREYWETRDAGIIGGPTFTTKKVDNVWVIVQRVEHDNPADYYNTCLKIGKKRSQVDATLTVLAASDCFVQDLEDHEGLTNKPSQSPKQQRKEPQQQQGGGGDTFPCVVSVLFDDKEGQATLKSGGFRWDKENKYWKKMVTEADFNSIKGIFPQAKRV